MSINRRTFFPPQHIFQEVKGRIEKMAEEEKDVDYITFVPDGEPTLDINLGVEIEMLREIGKRIAIITNASLLWLDDVRAEVSNADLISLKIDCAEAEVWKRINRPHASLRFERVLQGIKEFARDAQVEVITETMLVQNLNDSVGRLKSTADFIAAINPKRSYISVPIRPPAEGWVKSPNESVLNTAYQIFSERGLDVEYLIHYEGTDFIFIGDVVEDILSITAVHPLREESMRYLLKRANASWDVVEEMITNGEIVEVEYQGQKFYVRRRQ